MVLVATVTKEAVNKNITNVYDVIMNMVLTDDAVEVINRDYSIRYRSGDAIGGKTNELIAQMQEDIDDYKAEQVIYNAAAFDTAVATVQAGLVV